MSTKRFKTYDQFYKLGFDHFIYKRLMGLKKPKLRQHIFYMTLITMMIVAGSIF